MGKYGVKTESFLKLLDLLPEPCAPTTEQIRKIAKQVGCTENMGWRVLKKLRTMKNYSSMYSINEELKTCLRVLYRVMNEKMNPAKNLTIIEKSTIQRIEQILKFTSPQTENEKKLIEDEVLQKVRNSNNYEEIIKCS
jgi:hypothetical protein